MLWQYFLNIEEIIIRIFFVFHNSNFLPIKCIFSRFYAAELQILLPPPSPSTHMNFFDHRLTRLLIHAPPVYIWISELGQPLQFYFGLYLQFKAVEECEYALPGKAKQVFNVPARRATVLWKVFCLCHLTATYYIFYPFRIRGQFNYNF